MLKDLQVPVKEFAENSTESGYLIQKAEASKRRADGTLSVWPRVILADKQTGEKFSLSLGKAAADVMAVLVIGRFTVIKKGKKMGKGDNGYFPYSVQQDDEDVMDGEGLTQ